jgi:hypothetical protein
MRRRAGLDPLAQQPRRAERGLDLVLADAVGFERPCDIRQCCPQAAGGIEVNGFGSHRGGDEHEQKRTQDPTHLRSLQAISRPFSFDRIGVGKEQLLALDLVGPNGVLALSR